ncbi:MAG: hypothetical protein IRZ08_11185 [Frankia sp.]|nr:hypothetical protein [Frankia sp.]
MPARARATTSSSNGTTAASSGRATRPAGTRPAGTRPAARGRVARSATSAADKPELPGLPPEMAEVAEEWYRRGVADAVARETEHEAIGASIRLPFLHASLGLPRPHPHYHEQPTAAGAGAAAGVREEDEQAEPGWRLGPLRLPSPRKTAYYLGLGALAALELVEWPVAAAVAAGTWVAQHTRPEATAVPESAWHLFPHHDHGHNGHRTARAARA